jgi:hypothetical protein
MVRELEWTWTLHRSVIKYEIFDHLGDFANISRTVRDRRNLKKAIDSSFKGGHFGFLKVNFAPKIRKLSPKSPKHPVFATFFKISPDRAIAGKSRISHNKQLIGDVHKRQ